MLYFPVASATLRYPPPGASPRGGTQKVYICVIMKTYNHLSREQRYTIDRLLKQGKSYSFIAETIGVTTSTVSREIRRNQIPRERYSCRQVDTYASERKEWRYYPRKFTSKMRHDVEQTIRQQQWSPEQIAWREFPLWAKPPYTPFSIRTKWILSSVLSNEKPSLL